MSISDRSVVKTQYASTDRLDTRISIHAKYSRIKQPFSTWIASQQHFQPGDNILELGCGTGAIWKDVTLPAGCRLTLTDLSPAMLETTRSNTRHLSASYALCDAQALPYPNESFDVVIAHMMLYHVPDIDKAFREIHRVLKPHGRLYAATSGEHGIVETVLDLLQLPGNALNHRFTLQNGAQQLHRYFSHVQIASRSDMLDVTNLSDLLQYLRSMEGMSILADIPDHQLLPVLQSHMDGGVLSLPKEYGMFICTKNP